MAATPKVMIKTTAGDGAQEAVAGPLPLPRAQGLAESMAAADGWYAGGWVWDSLTPGLWRLLGHKTLTGGNGRERPAQLLQATGYILTEAG